MSPRRPLPLLSFVSLLWLVGCGGGGDEVTVTITPGAVELNDGDSQRFTAVVSGTLDQRVRWSVREGGGGSIDTAGLYVAPAQPGTFTVVAESLAEEAEGATATAQVTVRPLLTEVILFPDELELEAHRYAEFAVLVKNAQSQEVTWSVDEGALGGTVDANGVYTPSGELGVFHVRATSVEDPTAFGRATVTVVPPKINVGLSPSTLKLAAGATQQFEASVTGTFDTEVTWSIEPNAGGNINAAGLFTAPADPGQYTLIARSKVDPSRTAEAQITVVPRTVTVSGNVSYTGSKSGRVYIAVVTSTGNIAGTSIEGPGPYTVRGVVAGGTATVYAYRDAAGIGAFVSNHSPLGSVQNVPLSANVTDVNVAVQEFFSTTPPQMAAPLVIPGEDAAALFLEPVLTGPGGNLVASHYTVYWSQSSNPGPSSAEGSLTVRAGAVALVRGLASGTVYYFSARALNGTVEGPVSAAAGPITPGPGAGGLSVSGTVQWTGDAPGGSRYVVVKSATEGRMTTFAGAQSPEAWSVSGLLASEYEVEVLVDEDEDGEIGFGDPTTLGKHLGTRADLTQGQDAQDLLVTLPTTHASPQVVTARWLWSAGNLWQLELAARSNARNVVAATVSEGPGILSPIDLWQDFNVPGELSTTLNMARLRPGIDDAWTFTFTYDDGTTEALQAHVTGVFDDAPVGLAPLGNSEPAPTFAWSLPESGPQVVAGQVSILDGQNARVWTKAVGGAVTQVAYDGPGLDLDAPYRWYAYSYDAHGNSAVTLNAFTPR